MISAMENLDFFFADISTQGSRNVLLADPKPYSFLLRKVNKEFVVTFVDSHLNVHDELLPLRRDCPLLLSNPHLHGPLEIFEYIRNISRDWLHPVTRGQHDVTGGDVNVSGNCCPICGNLNPSKSHRDKHRIWYCATCDMCLPKNSRHLHKCRDKTLYKCDFCDLSSCSEKDRADHIKAVHMKKFKCSKCSDSFDTTQQLQDHEGKQHGGGYICHYCGKIYESVSGRNKHRKKCKHRPDSDTNNNPDSGGHKVPMTSAPSNIPASASCSDPSNKAASRERPLPRNMQGQGDDPEAGSGLHDHDRGFINIQLELPEDSQRPEAEEAGPGGHERQDSVLSASISGHQSHSLSDMAETEDLAKTDQRHEVRGHMYASGGQEPWAREIGDTRDLGLEDRDQLMSPTQNPNRESSYLGKGHDLEGGSGIHGQDQGFINIQLEFPEDSQRPEAAEVSDSTMGWHGRETEDITKNGQERVASNPSNLQSSPPPASDSQPSPPDQPPKGSPPLELWLKMQQMKMRGKSFGFPLPRGLIVSLLFILNLVSTYLKKMLTICDHPLPLDDGDWARRGRPRKQDMHDCEECGKGYVRRKALQHQKSCKHTKIKAKMKAKCKWCSYSSSLKTNVSRHEKTCRGRPQIVKTLSPDAIWRIGK